MSKKKVGCPVGRPKKYTDKEVYIEDHGRHKEKVQGFSFVWFMVGFLTLSFFIMIFTIGDTNNLTSALMATLIVTVILSLCIISAEGGRREMLKKKIIRMVPNNG